MMSSQIIFLTLLSHLPGAIELTQTHNNVAGGIKLDISHKISSQFYVVLCYGTIKLFGQFVADSCKTFLQWFNARLQYIQCLAMEILQSCTKPSIYSYSSDLLQMCNCPSTNEMTLKDIGKHGRCLITTNASKHDHVHNFLDVPSNL